MANGFTGTILRIDLNKQQVKSESFEEDFYRKYLGGGAFGTYFLLRDAPLKVKAFDPENIITIAPGVTTGAMVSGVSRCSITAVSPATELVGDSQVGGNIGPYLKRAGYDALVISGKAQKPSYILIEDGKIEIKSAEKIKGRTILEAYDFFLKEHGEKHICVLQEKNFTC